MNNNMNWGSLEWSDIDNKIERDKVRNNLLSQLPRPIFLRDGSYDVRIVSNPFQFLVHWIKDPATQRIRRVHCTDVDCEICKSIPTTSEREREIKSVKVYSCFVLCKDIDGPPSVGPDLELRSLQLGRGGFIPLLNVIKNIKDDFRNYIITIKRARDTTTRFYNYKAEIKEKNTIDLLEIEREIKSFSTPMKLLLGTDDSKNAALSDWLEEDRIMARSW